MTKMSWLLVLGCVLWGQGMARETPDVVHVYNWSDYFAEDTLREFQARTGIRPVLDVYDSNETLEAKLFAGDSGYDVVFPTARPFAAREIQAGIYAPLNKALLPGWRNLDPALLESLGDVDPGNRHVVPYMWGTTGLGIDVQAVRRRLGAEAGLDSWALVFDPNTAARLADCGITLLDDPTEVFSAVLAYLGRDPNSVAAEDLEAATGVLKAIHPYVRYFHSSQYQSDLANGDICVAHGYSGDVLQARERAEEAGNGVQIAYLIPREGAALWTDVMAIPRDAPHPRAAHAFIDFLLDPRVIAQISNYVFYANANAASRPYLDPELAHDPGIYPGPQVMARLFAPPLRDDRAVRRLNRLWTRIKAGR